MHVERPNVFVSYHHSGDQAYYDVFSEFFHDRFGIVRDNSLERAINSNDVDYTRWRIRDGFIRGTSSTIVLCGPQTHNRKYVDWEIAASLDMDHGLVGVGLPTRRVDETGRSIAPARFVDNYESGYALWLLWENLSADALSTALRAATSKDRRLIRNHRQLRQRNS